MKEIWKDINDLEGYQISNLGRVKSLARYINCKGGKKRLMLGKIIVGYKEPNRYTKIVVNKQMRYVHRLVAQAFIPNTDNKPTVNHKDGDKHNNRVDNLEWATQSENNYHSFRMGLRVPYNRVGTNNPNYKHGKRMKITI
jgi:hypothetical protein